MSRNNASFVPAAQETSSEPSERADASGGGHGNWGSLWYRVAVKVALVVTEPVFVIGTGGVTEPVQWPVR